MSVYLFRKTVKILRQNRKKIIWRTWSIKGQIFHKDTDDFRSEGLRRLVINAAFHLTGLEVPAQAEVTPVDKFEPTFYGFIAEKNHPGYFKKLNLRPSDFVPGKSRQTGLPK